MAEGEDDVSLPRAAVNKLIKEMLPNMRISNDARELVLNCCTEFIHLVAAEANEECTRQAKKTIAPEHVLEALKGLGFNGYAPEVEEVLEEYKVQAQQHKKKATRLEHLGIPEEELLRQQQALFAEARQQQMQINQEEMLRHQQAMAAASGSSSAQSGDPSSGSPTLTPAQQQLAQLQAVAAGQYPPGQSPPAPGTVSGRGAVS